MPPRDPLTFPKGSARLDTLRSALKKADRVPHIGVTQGGSSRKDSGCKPAATDGNWRPFEWKK